MAFRYKFNWPGFFLAQNFATIKECAELFKLDYPNLTRLVHTGLITTNTLKKISTLYANAKEYVKED